MSHLLQNLDPVTSQPDMEPGLPRIVVDPTQVWLQSGFAEYRWISGNFSRWLKVDQAALGFGAALSNAAASLIYNSPQKQQIINDLFSPEGIHCDVIRLVMGGSDFNAVPPYTYNDLAANETDVNLANFSIEQDLNFVIPLIKEIKAVCLFLKFNERFI